MSRSATAGELLDLAQRQAWDLATGLSHSTNSEAHVGSWPQLAGAAAHALDALPLSPGDRHQHWRLNEALAGLAAGSPGERRQPQLERMSELLGALGDLWSGEHSPGEAMADRDAHAAQSKILSVVETAARATLGRLDAGSRHGHIRFRRHLEQVRDSCHDGAVVPPGQRGGRYDDVAAVTPDDLSLAGAVQRWQSVTIEALQAPVSARAARMAAGDAALLSVSSAVVAAAAGKLDVVPADVAKRAGTALAGAGRAWQDASLAWPRYVQGGAVTPEQMAVGAELRNALEQLTRHDGRWATPEQIALRAEVDETLATLRRGAAAVERIGVRYEASVQTTALGEGFTIPARRLEKGPQGLDVAASRIAARGGWVPLPSSHSEAAGIAAAAGTVAIPSRDARVAFDATARRPEFPHPLSRMTGAAQRKQNERAATTGRHPERTRDAGPSRA